jgi:hypothetical protein
MSSIRAYIRTQNKSIQSAKVRFLLIDKKVNLSYVSDINVNPLYWDSVRQGYAKSMQIPSAEQNEINSQILKIKNLILKIYTTENAQGLLNSRFLTELINQELQPGKTDSVVEKEVISTTQSKHIKQRKQSIDAKSEKETSRNGITLLEAFDYLLKHNDICYQRKQTYKVVRYSIEKYIFYKSLKNKKFSLTLENTTVDTLWELEAFFKTEVDLKKLYPKIKTIFPKYEKPSVRAQNTVISCMRILRAVFNFSITHEMTQNYPFRRFKMKEQVYGSPFYPTREELKHLYAFQFEDKKLSEQRDIFIFQCQVGMRIHDFYQLTRNNISNGILEYIPSKTKRFRTKTISIPLNAVALEILDRYSSNDKILPFVCEQIYNKRLKIIFKIAGLTRPVTQLDPLTEKEVVKPLCEIIHSHAARKYFCASLFELVKDQSIVAELSAHSPSSIAFQRYRNISYEMKKSLTDNIF